MAPANQHHDHADCYEQPANYDQHFPQIRHT